MYNILIIGGSGYVGGRLVGRLLRDRHSVRCLVRDPRKLSGRKWPGVEIFKGNILDRESVERAVKGCEIIYYLAHSIYAGENKYEELDRRSANIVKKVACDSGIKRIIYLGILGNRDVELPRYNRSRNEVGKILASGCVPVTEFRAAMIVGSGSLSFDLMHAMVNRLPVIIAPRWINTISQPISTRDTIRYLAGCLNVPESTGKVIDIGGPDILSYKEMLLRLATQLDLKRRIFFLPTPMPRLSSFWINLVTPIPTSLARMLVDGLQCKMVVENDLALKLFPLQLMGFDEAVARTLRRVQELQVETRWTDASFNYEEGQQSENNKSELLKNIQQLEINASPDQVYKVFASIGGERGWYYGNFLWRMRGFFDKIIGGVGLRRGRRHPIDLNPGDALDFWRVETVEVGKKVILRAEMKLPGKAWLEFCAEPRDGSKTIFTQKALFYPHGLGGFIYWYVLVPIHFVLFAKMAREIGRRAELGVLNKNL